MKKVLLYNTHKVWYYHGYYKQLIVSRHIGVTCSFFREIFGNTRRWSGGVTKGSE